MATVIPPPKRPARWPWAAAGVLIGSVAMVVAMSRLSGRRPQCDRVSATVLHPASTAPRADPERDYERTRPTARSDPLLPTANVAAPTPTP